MVIQPFSSVAAVSGAIVTTNCVSGTSGRCWIGRRRRRLRLLDAVIVLAPRKSIETLLASLPNTSQRYRAQISGLYLRRKVLNAGM